MRHGGYSWAVPEVLDRVGRLRGMQGRDPAEKALLSSLTIRMKPPVNPRSVSTRSAGVNEIYRCDLDNGAKAYHKPFSGLDQATAVDYGHFGSNGRAIAWQPVHEAAAWQLAKRLGGTWRQIVCPCVIREVAGRLGSLSQASPLPVKGGRVVRSDQFRAAAFFDVLVGQQDRNRGNYFTDGTGGPRVSLYDHGFCFARPGDDIGTSLLSMPYVGERLLRTEEDALMQIVVTPDLLGMRLALATDRANALEKRARRMLTSGVILDVGDF